MMRGAAFALCICLLFVVAAIDVAAAWVIQKFTGE
jgi:hypothetical protein